MTYRFLPLVAVAVSLLPLPCRAADFKSDYWPDRYRAAETSSSVADLVKALKEDKQYFVRARAAKTLGQLGSNAQSAVPALRAALKDKEEHVRESAAVALSKIGADAKDALPDLKAALKDKDSNVRSS